MPPPELIRHYEGAIASLGVPPDPLTTRLIAAGADLEAAEFVLRRQNPANGLTKRAIVLLSLAEARPEWTDLFVLERPSRVRAWARLATAPVTALLHLGKGKILVWWYGRST